MRFFFLALMLVTTPAFGQTLFDPAITMSDSPLRRGLVGYWRLEEASGTRYDCSKNGYHLTSVNSVGQTAGKVGNCSSFVAASHQSLTGFTNNVITNDFTIACWAKLTTKTLGCPATKFDYSISKRSFFLQYLDSSDRWNFGVSSDGTATAQVAATTFGSPATNVWYFVTAWKDTAESKIWISVNNGTADSAAQTGTVFASNVAFTIGAMNPDSPVQWLDGFVDEFGLWNRQLTSTERTRLYNAGVGTHFPWAHP